MKRLLLVVFIAISITCFAQSTPDMLLTKAKTLARNELKSELHDYSSYEPVRWSSLDSVFSSIKDDSNIRLLIEKLMDKHSKLPGDPSKLSLFADLSELEKKCKEAYERSKTQDYGVDYQLVCLNQWTAISEFNIAQNKVKEAINVFEPQFMGWSITHRFRAKNSLGAKVISEWVFRFDPDVSVVKSIIKE